MVQNPGIKLNLFTQPIDEKYCANNISIEYYSYEGCNIQDLDNLINKSDRCKSNDDEPFNEKQINHKNEGLTSNANCNLNLNVSVNKNRKLSDFLSNTWKENLKVIKHANHGQSATKASNFVPGNHNIEARKLTFDVSSSTGEGRRLFQF